MIERDEIDVVITGKTVHVTDDHHYASRSVNTSRGRPRKRLSPCSARKISAAEDSMYCGRQN